MSRVYASRVAVLYLEIPLDDLGDTQFAHDLRRAIGVVTPGMPMAVFLLIAMWAFSKSPERFWVLLHNHKTLGSPVRDWHEHRVIPMPAEIPAFGMISRSAVIPAALVAKSAWVSAPSPNYGRGGSG